MELGLALPLLVLTALNAANLAGLLQQLGHGEAWQDDGRFAGLAWGLLNLLGTLTALRACWDPPMQDPAAWLAVDMARRGARCRRSSPSLPDQGHQ